MDLSQEKELLSKKMLQCSGKGTRLRMKSSELIARCQVIESC